MISISPRINILAPAERFELPPPGLEDQHAVRYTKRAILRGDKVARDRL